MIKLLVLFAFLILAGCQTTKKIVGLSDEHLPPGIQENERLVRFSDNPHMPSERDRQYKRMTQERMEEEAEVHSQAGSMWVMDGQGAYLFAQNKSRREGDLLNVKIEGGAQKQIETKVAVIKKLLKQLEEEEKKARDAKNPEQPKLADGQAAPAAGAQRAPASADASKKEKEEDEKLNLDFVPTRIVERQPDGNYRLKGQQPFMIGKREYKVLVLGIIRPEDFNDDGVSSNKLLDPQYEVVSLRRKEL